MPDNTKFLITKDKQTAFTDDVYMKMANEIEQIRSSVSMYVSPLGTMGGIHLLKEIVNNAIDEAMNEKSSSINSKKIYVTFDERSTKFTVTDEGRGIPLDLLKEVVCEKHVGTKTMGKANRNKDLAGMNGVGLTVVAALSDYMSITSYRGKHAKTLEFKDGQLHEGKPITLKKEQYGCSDVIIPSEKYLGPMEITCDIVEDYFRHMSYILRGGIEIYLEEIDKDGKKHKTVYKRKGLVDNVNFLSSSLEFSPIEIEVENEFFGLEIAFSYDRTLNDMLCESYTNYIITTEGGVHEQTAQRAICEFLSREAKKLDPNNKVEITYDDCKRGLVMAVNCRHVRPVLEGQHKSRFSSPDVAKFGRSMIANELTTYFHNNPGMLRKIINFLRQVAKARLEANKIKGVGTKQRVSTFLEDAEIKGFSNISDRYSKGYKELYICEGESASGALLNCRNSRYQALYGIMGVTDNVYDMNLTQLMKTTVFKNLIRILGCGVGSEFDIHKLRWNKVIICTDSDSDGRNITSLILCFFLVFMPELITAGKIYKAMPPLYVLKKDSLRKYYKGREWLYDKVELYRLFDDIVSSNVEIVLDDGTKKKNGDKMKILSKKEAMKWMMMNAEYSLELENLGKKSTCGERIIEYVCYYKLIYGNNTKKFKEMIEKQFPEMEYDMKTKSLAGTWEGEQFSLICDSLFDRSAVRFLKVLTQNPSLFVYVKGSKNGDTKFDKMTIGEFFDTMGRRYIIKIDQRFKGLGEAEAELLFITTMNPKLRKLLRITMPDTKKAIDTFKILHQKSEAMIDERRKLLDEADISYADIDN